MRNLRAKKAGTFDVLMDEETTRSATAPAGRLDERVLDTLQRIRGKVAFSGLRRVLGAHPESLARTLRRLEREGAVVRVDGGYRAATFPRAASPVTDGALRTVAEVELASHVGADVLVERMAARWFGSLRWVGIVTRPEGNLLAWAPRSAEGLVLLELNGRRLRVLLPEHPAHGEAAELDDAAYELLFHAVEAVRGLGGSSASVPTDVLPLTALSRPSWGAN